MSAFLANAARGIGIFHGSQYYQRVSAVYNPIQTREVVESISGDSLKTSPRVSDDSPNETTRSSGSENLKSDISASKRNLLEKKINKVENDMKILKIIDSLAAVFGIFGLAIAMIEYEDNFSDVGKERNESSQYGNDLRTFITVTTGFLLIFIVIRSKLSFNIMKEKQMNLDVKVSTYWNSSYLKSLIVELVICAIHWPPGYDVKLEFVQMNGKLVQSMDSICAAIMLLRVFLMFRLVFHFSKWSNKKCQAICSAYGSDGGLLFSIKAILKDNPFFILGCSMMTSIVVFALALRIFERPYNIDKIDNGQDFEYIWNSMWVIIITMCTVGYGDFFARTHIGRCISVLACFWGIFNITLMVVTLTNYTAFSKGETRAYNYLARTSALDNAKIHAAKFIRASYQRYLLIKIGGKKNQFLKERREKTYEMRIHYEKFKDYKKAAIFAEPTGEELLRTLYEALNIQLERIEGRLTQAKDLNDQVRTVEKSQRHTKEAIKSSIKLMETLEGFLIEKYQNNV